MPRRLRLHVAGGSYYVAQAGTGTEPLFRGSEDVRRFEQLLCAALHRTRSTLHAYCWLPHSIHCAIQVSDSTVGRLMQMLTSPYARSIQRRYDEPGLLFCRRYRATLIDPTEYLLPLVRYLHHLPTQHGEAHSSSSDHAYRSSRSPSWLTTSRVRHLIERSQAGRYEEFIAAPPTAAEIRLFERGGEEDPRVIGNASFVATLPRHARPYRTTTTLDQVIDTVACRLALDRGVILSGSRERELALARALIAWYATERRIAPLSEIARRLRRDPSTLSVGISRYRARRADLFDLERLHDLAPLANID